MRFLPSPYSITYVININKSIPKWLLPTYLLLHAQLMFYEGLHTSFTNLLINIHDLSFPLSLVVYCSYATTQSTFSTIPQPSLVTQPSLTTFNHHTYSSLVHTHKPLCQFSISCICISIFMHYALSLSMPTSAYTFQLLHSFISFPCRNELHGA